MQKRNPQPLIQSQGYVANRNGKYLERTIEGIFRRFDIPVVSYSEWMRSPQSERDIVIRDFPYTTVYGSKGKMEFYVRMPSRGIETRIECRSQRVAGSVDEKLCYLMENCLNPEHVSHTVVVLKGDGMRKGAVDWLKRKAREHFTPGKIIDVFDARQFTRWLKRILGN